MTEPERPAIAGIEQARKLDREARDAEVSEELASVEKLASELSGEVPEAPSDPEDDPAPDGPLNPA